MIRRYAAESRALLILSDALLAMAVIAVISWLGFAGESRPYWSDVIRPTELIALVYALIWVAALALRGLYPQRHSWIVAAEAADVLKTAVWVALGTAAFLFLVRPPSVSRLFFVVLFPSQAAATTISHTVLRRAHAGERNTRNLLIVGAGEGGRAFDQRLEAHPWLGLHVVGFLDADNGLAATLPKSWPAWAAWIGSSSFSTSW